MNLIKYYIERKQEINSINSLNSSPIKERMINILESDITEIVIRTLEDEMKVKGE